MNIHFALKKLRSGWRPTQRRTAMWARALRVERKMRRTVVRTVARRMEVSVLKFDFAL